MGGCGSALCGWVVGASRRVSEGKGAYRCMYRCILIYIYTYVCMSAHVCLYIGIHVPVYI